MSTTEAEEAAIDALLAGLRPATLGAPAEAPGLHGAPAEAPGLQPADDQKARIDVARDHLVFDAAFGNNVPPIRGAFCARGKLRTGKYRLSFGFENLHIYIYSKSKKRENKYASGQRERRQE